jgi:hypothetical protein
MELWQHCLAHGYRSKKNVKQIMEWTKQHFTQLLGCNQKVKWLRIHNDKIIPKEILTKRHFV